MSERGYFSFRYMTPGFTFLLVVVSINIVPLFKLATHSDIGTFLGFLSLAAGSAIGFLIAQIWMLKYMQRGRILGITELQPIEQLLRAKCIQHGLRGQLGRAELCAILDYMTSRRTQKHVWDYMTRRLDMYHTLKATIYALGMGSVVALIFRLYFERFFIEPYNNFSSLETYCVWENAEGFLLFVLLMCAALLICVLRAVERKLMNNYCPVLQAFISHIFQERNEEDQPKIDVTKDLRTAFPQLRRKLTHKNRVLAFLKKEKKT